MSYILEALKKADAERRGELQQPVQLPPSFAASGRPPSAWNRRWPWAALAAATATAGAVAIWMTTAPAPTVVAPSPPSQLPDKIAAIPAAPPPAAAPEKPKEKPARKPAAKKRPAEREQTGTVKAAVPEPAVGTVRDLPEHIQRDIPQLAIGGYIYSGNKADRSVLINKRLLHEGDEVAPGLTLEQMRPNGMILNYKGYRYRSSY